MAQPFDYKRLELSGEAAPLAEHVQNAFAPNWAFGLFSASSNGVLAYHAGADMRDTRLTWIDRTGLRLSTLSGPGNISAMNFSPDRKSVAVALTEGSNQDIWIYDLQRKLRTRLTFDSAVEDSPVWSPDGRTIVFASNRSGHFDLYRKSADGSGAEELIYAGGMEKFATSWSPDGRFLLYWTRGDSKTGNDIWVLPLAPGAKPYPLVQTTFNESFPRFSNDGHWVSYQSNLSGGSEIYMIPFSPGGGAPAGRRQVSIDGGRFALWRRDGRELFYISPDGKLMAAEMNAKSGSIEPGKLTALCSGFSGLYNGPGFLYDVTYDGHSFLAVLPPEQATGAQPIAVVQNWTAGLKK